MRRLVEISTVTMILLLGCSGEQKSDTQSASQPKVATGEERISISELAKWQFLGEGAVTIDESESAVRLSESEGSKGVTLVSPASYGTNVVVSFKVKPETYQSVNVVMLSVSDKDSGGSIQVPADYDGNFGFWTQGTVQNYIFAFHNAAHDRKPFIVKDPGMALLVEADDHVTAERWHDIEIGRKGLMLWIKIDGVMIAEASDPDDTGLPGGKVCFRMRGTPDSAASALFKEVVIRKE